MKYHNRGWSVFWVLWVSLMVVGCDTSGNDGPPDDKKQVQQEIDAKNPNTNQAFCIRVSNTNPLDRPVRIYPEDHDKRIDEKTSRYELSKIQQGKALLARLKIFTKQGLLLESAPKPDKGIYFYMYKFSEKGERYLNLEGGTNLCFGRIVVDEVFDTTAKQSNEDDGEFKVISFSYHLDGIPDWMQDEDIQGLYTSHTDFINLVQGKSLTGQHRYKVGDDGSLTLWDGIRGNRYIL